MGSLWWDTQQHRIQWRQDRLLTDDSIRVNVPLRYGRRSSSRGNTFTMVMSEGYEDGQALIVPCRNELAVFDGLKSEAEHLWAAEHRNALPGSISASWGGVGVRFHEGSRDALLAEAWKRHFTASGRPVSPIDVHGTLNIRWPTGISDNQRPDFDLILATATQAEKRTPTPDEVADAWVHQDDGYETYFFENVRAGIRTSEDVAIWRCIEKRNPRWLATDSYSDVIELLREESRV